MSKSKQMQKVLLTAHIETNLLHFSRGVMIHLTLKVWFSNLF